VCLAEQRKCNEWYPLKRQPSHEGPNISLGPSRTIYSKHRSDLPTPQVLDGDSESKLPDDKLPLLKQRISVVIQDLSEVIQRLEQLDAERT
jgi:hypothetical protein